MVKHMIRDAGNMLHPRTLETSQDARSSLRFLQFYLVLFASPHPQMLRSPCLPEPMEMAVPDFQAGPQEVRDTVFLFFKKIVCLDKLPSKTFKKLIK